MCKQLLRKLFFFSVQGDVVVENILECVGEFYLIFGGIGWFNAYALV